MGAAGVGTVVANLSTGRPLDEHLVANILIIGLLHGALKAVTDRIPGRGTAKTDSTDQTSPHREPRPGGTEVMVDSAERVTATDFEPVTGGGLKCRLVDSDTGARSGSPRSNWPRTGHLAAALI